MPPKGMSQAAVQALVAASVAEALANYDAARRQNPSGSGGNGEMGEMEGTPGHALIRTS